MSRKRTGKWNYLYRCIIFIGQKWFNNLYRCPFILSSYSQQPNKIKKLALIIWFSFSFLSLFLSFPLIPLTNPRIQTQHKESFSNYNSSYLKCTTAQLRIPSNYSRQRQTLLFLLDKSHAQTQHKETFKNYNSSDLKCTTAKLGIYSIKARDPWKFGGKKLTT